jgi:hypothetical protein
VCSDLWKFEVETREWIWVGGPSTPNQRGTWNNSVGPENTPGARYEASCWIDKPQGLLYLFGGSISRMTTSYRGVLGDFPSGKY